MKHSVTAALAAAALLLSWTAAPAAHDVPSDVRIQVFLKPEGQRLRLLVRAPLASMNDISWPTGKVQFKLSQGDVLHIRTPGGGGWGN